MRQTALLASIAALVFFAQLGTARLWDVDEAIFSAAAREMYERGDAVVPYFNGELFTHKPPMMYWLMIAGYETFGVNEFAARFFSAVFGVGTVLLTYRLGRLMFSPAVGFWSALALASNLNFVLIARAATPDAFLVFFSTLALTAFVSSTAKAQAQSGPLNERNAPWAGQTRFEPSWLGYACVYAALALGVLTKGPVGVVLPTAAIGLFLLGALGTGGECAGGGLAREIELRTAPRQAGIWRAAFFAHDVEHAAADGDRRGVGAGRLVVCLGGPQDRRRVADWVFRRAQLRAVLAPNGEPWRAGVLLPGGDRDRFLSRGRCCSCRCSLACAASWRPTIRGAGTLLVLSWIAVWVGFFSLAGTKLPSYVVPAYPALALVTGSFRRSLAARAEPRLRGCRE